MQDPVKSHTALPNRRPLRLEPSYSCVAIIDYYFTINLENNIHEGYEILM